MVKQRRTSESPLAHLDCVSVETGDIRHGRRALEPDEIRRLLETTATQRHKPDDEQIHAHADRARGQGS
jgi:hypothetical protein